MSGEAYRRWSDVGGMLGVTMAVASTKRDIDAKGKLHRESRMAREARMPDLAGRTYVPKLYRISASRAPVVELIERAIEASGGRVVYSSFAESKVAPIYVGAEDRAGGRYGMLIYPFTTTRRGTRNRPADERRTQIRLGDPVRHRDESNEIGVDVAGVDVTLLLAVDPESEFIVGLDPQVYADLPIGISVYYRDEHVELAETDGWAAWEHEKNGGTRRKSWEGLETLVGFRPDRFLDYVRFEADASALGLNPALRLRLAESARVRKNRRQHKLEHVFGLGSDEILDIISSNHRLGIAVRGGVAERHLERHLLVDQSLVRVTPIDKDGQPDFVVVDHAGRELTIECKTISPNPYANGDMKVEVQKTRDSGAGRQYTFSQFDILAACTFSVTGRWGYRFSWTRDLAPSKGDATRIGPYQHVTDSWPETVGQLLSRD